MREAFAIHPLPKEKIVIFVYFFKEWSRDDPWNRNFWNLLNSVV